MSENLPPPPPPPPYGFAPPAWQPPRSTGTPGPVSAAAIITYVACGLSMLMLVALALFAVVLGSLMWGAFESDDQLALGALVTIVVVVVLVINVIGCWFAYRMTKREEWARTALAIWSGLVLVVGIMSVSPPGVLQALAGIAILVLIFLPESNAWFREADGS